MKTTITVEVEVPQEWLDFCLKYSDLFRRDHCGYWAFGVQRSPLRGWLIYVNPEEAGEPPDEEYARTAADLWARGGSLPENFYRLDEDAAVRAFQEGCKRYGVGWFEDGKTDANTYDVVVQLALLGEVVYG